MICCTSWVPKPSCQSGSKPFDITCMFLLDLSQWSWLNRPFAQSGHMVLNHTCWWASSAVGRPKQRQVQVDWYEWHCFGSPTAQLAHQHVWFSTMWPDRAKGLFYPYNPVPVGGFPYEKVWDANRKIQIKPLKETNQGLSFIWLQKIPFNAEKAQ